MHILLYEKVILLLLASYLSYSLCMMDWIYDDNLYCFNFLQVALYEIPTLSKDYLVSEGMIIQLNSHRGR